MGTQKLLLPLGGRRLLERALDATRDFETIVVVSPGLAAAVPAAPRRRVVINGEPERGMSHSLALAAAAVEDPAAAIAVLLADTPLVDRALVEAVLRALGESDVAYPVRDGTPGHPVIFGPRVRGEIARLAAGDTLRHLRDDPRWRRVAVPVGDDAPFVDIDTPEDYARAIAGETFGDARDV
jgi:molybdenum cofactor cytidylyltransferase